MISVKFQTAIIIDNLISGVEPHADPVPHPSLRQSHLPCLRQVRYKEISLYFFGNSFLGH